MSMDEQIVDLMRDQFRALSEKIDGVHDARIEQFRVLNSKIDEVHESMQEHMGEDKRYWAKIDKHEGQMSVWKWLTTPGLAGFFAWLYNAIKH